MAEEKKKTTTTKTANNQKKKNSNNKKTSTTKKVNNQNKKNTTKKVNNNQKQTPKKNTQKKVVPKKQEQQKTAKKIEEQVVTEKTVEIEVVEEVKQEESVLEKTLIFDGRENKNLAEVVKKLEEDNVVLEDKIIKRSKAKKIAVNILTALIFITIIGTIIFLIYSDIEKEKNSQTLNSNIFDKVSNKYNNTSEIETEQKIESDINSEEYENIKTITLGEFEKKILEKKDMIVIITSTTCYYSIEYEPIVDEVFDELDKEIYRINITSLTKEEIDRFRTYYAFKETPTIFKLKNGVVEKELIGKKDKTDLKAWLK